MTLTSVQIAFLRRIAAEKPIKGAASAVADFFAKQYNIGFRIGRSCEYQPQHHKMAAQLLATLKLPLMARSPSTLRADAVDDSGLPEKNGTKPPHRDSVAFKPMAGKCLLADGAPFTIPPESYAVLTVEQALSISAQRLLVVENLETFRLLERYRWIDYQGLNVLAIYLGDEGFRQDEVAAVVAQRNEPTWMFADFDPAGLAMAARLPRLERVVLPDTAWLTRKTYMSRRDDLFASQFDQYSATLERESNPLIHPLWQLLKDMKKGLPQEGMAAAPAQEASCGTG
jgi:hypothetical protein